MAPIPTSALPKSGLEKVFADRSRSREGPTSNYGAAGAKRRACAAHLIRPDAEGGWQRAWRGHGSLPCRSRHCLAVADLPPNTREDLLNHSSRDEPSSWMSACAIPASSGHRERGDEPIGISRQGVAPVPCTER